MEEITRDAYWREVRSIAESVVEEWLADNPECESEDDAREGIGERLWETCDGHQWVIYTYYHFQVLQHSANDGALFEEFGGEGATDENGCLNTAALAFAALHADCSEHLYEAFAEAWEAKASEAATIAE